MKRAVQFFAAFARRYPCLHDRAVCFAIAGVRTMEAFVFVLIVCFKGQLREPVGNTYTGL
jgi:hypothetical protein